MARPRNKAPQIQTATTVYKGADGKWHAYVSIEEGKPRKHIQNKDEDICRQLTFDAEQKRDQARIEKTLTPLGETWFLHWLDDIAPHGKRGLAPRTIDDYLSKLTFWVFPALGKTRLEDWTVTDLDRLYTKMRDAGKAESTIQKTHAIIRRGLKVAMQREQVSRNVAALMDNPGDTSATRKGLPEGAAAEIIKVLNDHPHGLRWKVGFTGRRQGEAIALRWQYVDFATGVVDMAWQVQRLTWRHGCGDPVACAPQFCRTEKCVPPWEHGCPVADRAACRKGNRTLAKSGRSCPRRVRAAKCPAHERACPEPCPLGCKKHAARCPSRKGGGLRFTRPKTFRADQTEHLVAFPKAVMVELAAHKLWQDEVQRPEAGDLWEEHDLVFCTDIGRPIEPRKDWEEWRDILRSAGLPHQGTHSQRHTVGELLRDLGVAREDIQDLFLHVDPRTTARYTKKSIVQSTRVADRLGEALFPAGYATQVQRDEKDIAQAG